MESPMAAGNSTPDDRSHMHPDAQLPIGRLRRGGGDHLEATSHTIHRRIFNGAGHPGRRHEGVPDRLDLFETMPGDDFFEGFHERLQIIHHLLG